MLKGSLTFIAKLKGHGLTIPKTEFNPKRSGVEKVELEGVDGQEIRATVYIACAASKDNALSVAHEVTEVTLDRIGFLHRIAIGIGECTDTALTEISPQPGMPVAEPGRYTIIGYPVTAIVGLNPVRLKAQLENVPQPGQQYFALYRAARQSTGPIEEFMHLYHILLMLCGDDQGSVDAFIRSRNPLVQQSPSPHKPKVMETVYTRLRNEMAHPRKGVDLNGTKEEMANRLGDLIAITQEMIETSP
jgi:hypothetical protein